MRARLVGEMPSFGAGRLQNRDDREAYGKEKETILLRPAKEWYRSGSVLCRVKYFRKMMGFFLR